MSVDVKRALEKPTKASPISVLYTTRLPVVPPAPPGGEPKKSIAVTIIKAIRVVVVWVRHSLADLIAWLAERFAPTWQRLDFTMQPQQQTNWCWAAVATSVALFYDPSSTWTQCAVVNAELGRTDCCTHGSSAACNVPWYLDLALQRVGHFDSWSSGAMAFADVRTEIDDSRPLGVRVGWSGGGGHFLIIDGYLADATEQVAVEDPWYGASDLTHAALSTSYQGSGTWTHSYETQP